MISPGSSAALTEAESLSPVPLHLSVTHVRGNRTIPIASPEWRTLRAKIITRDNRTCASCAYISPHIKGRGLQISHRNGDISNNDHTNLTVHCPPCEAIRHCRFAGFKGWVQLASSDMEQVEIVRKTRMMFEDSGRVPQIQEVDPLATLAEIDIVDFANKLTETDRAELTEEEKGLKGFFTQDAWDMFAITMAIGLDRLANFRSSNPSDAQAFKILAMECSLPWIRFSPESHSTLSNFLATWPPSSTMQSQVAWIYVDNARPQPADERGSTDIFGLCQAWEDICTDHQPTVTDLDELAQRFHVLVGKWLVFVQPGGVDFLWSRIAKATHAGTLGISAKVSPLSDSSSHVICVYTRDYTNRTDVDKVRNGLRRLGVKGKIGYKPDIYTHCRVYKDNPWRIFPTRYQD